MRQIKRRQALVCETEMNTPMDSTTIIDRLQAHIAQMAPHQKNRDSGKLLIEAAGTLAKWGFERYMMAKLAANKPMFDNPIIVWEAEKLRDAILEERKPK